MKRCPMCGHQEMKLPVDFTSTEVEFCVKCLERYGPRNTVTSQASAEIQRVDNSTVSPVTHGFEIKGPDFRPGDELVRTKP